MQVTPSSNSDITSSRFSRLEKYLEMGRSTIGSFQSFSLLDLWSPGRSNKGGEWCFTFTFQTISSRTFGHIGKTWLIVDCLDSSRTYIDGLLDGCSRNLYDMFSSPNFCFRPVFCLKSAEALVWSGGGLRTSLTRRQDTAQLLSPCAARAAWGAHHAVCDVLHVESCYVLCDIHTQLLWAVCNVLCNVYNVLHDVRTQSLEDSGQSVTV